MEVELKKIRTDGGTQMRAELNQDAIEDYRQKMEDGEKFPPIVVYSDGSDYWLADGFHRVAAAKLLGVLKTEATVNRGGKREAILHAVGANGSHGLPRTNADKRRAVEVLLADPEWAKWSDNKIAKTCLVGNQLVGHVRSSLCDSQSERTYTDRHGNTTTMNTANIGRKEKTVIDGDTGELIENALVETVTTKPFNKPAEPDESDTGIGVVYRGNAATQTKSQISGRDLATLRDLFAKLRDLTDVPSMQFSPISIRRVVGEMADIIG